MDRTDLVAQAVRLALATGMAGLVAFVPAYAQDSNDVAVQEKVVVTGTRIKRSEYEGALPITVITREDIDASGELSVAELLRTQTFNTFGSPKQQSGSENIGGSVNAISMRGLGPNYTLVLVNGRRIAAGPMAGTAMQNLSMIPLAAVERVEVLRDGASAIYGTDALAGVINIVLRRDYSGINLSYMAGRPTQSGGDEDSYSITGGVSGAKGNVTFGMDVQKQDIVYSRDRDFTSGGENAFGFPSTYRLYLAEDDPRNPLGESVRAGTFPDPRCPPEIGADPEFPWSVEGADRWAPDGGCLYAWWGEGAIEAANDTKSFFVDTNYELTPNAEFFTRGLFSYNEVTGRYAASPAILRMDQNAPQNPTDPANPFNYRGDAFGGQSVDLDTDGDGVPDTTVDGPFDLDFLYRNIPGGNRDHVWDDTLLDYVAGMRGIVDWLGAVDWEIAAQWSEQTSDLTGQGEVLAPELQSEVDSGSFDVFGVFGPYDDDELEAATRATASRTGKARHRIAGGDATIAFDVVQLGSGPVPVALGIEYRDEDYDLRFDEQTASGAFGGDNTDTQPVSGARVVKSVFAETAIPILPRLELNLAARYDDYNDFGTTVNPKASVAFRPLDSLLLRASFGSGFKAPEMELLYEGTSTTSELFIDSWRCSQTPADTDGDGRSNVDLDQLPRFHPCQVLDYEQLSFSGNPDLQPEESDNWTAGFIWSPSADVSVALDYYDIKLKQQIWGEAAQNLADEELRLRQAGETGNRAGSVVRDEFGRILNVYLTYENVERIETNGIDGEISYAFGMGRLGDFNAVLRWTHVLEFRVPEEGGSHDIVGSIYTPEDRGQLTLNWSLGDYSAAIVGNYISEQDDDAYYGPGGSEHLASFTTWDVQASYLTPWNGQVTLGARNVFDRDPPRNERGVAYDMTQHEIYGRVPYIRIQQDF